MVASVETYDITNVSSSANITLDTPTGTVAGTVLVAHIACTLGATWNALAGWSIIQSSSQSVLYRRICDGTEGSTFTFTNNQALGNQRGILFRIDGADQTTPIVDPKAKTNAASLNPTSDSVTATEDGSLLVVGLNLLTSTTTITVPSGMAEEINDATGQRKAVASLGVNTGATGAKTWTLGASTASATFSFVVNTAPTVIESTGSAAGSATATGTGAGVDLTTGSSAGAATASATGAAVAQATGTAAGTASATGEAATVLGAIGSSTGTGAGSAEGVGVAIGAGEGSASGTATASGVSGATMPTTGTAASTSDAEGVGELVEVSESMGSAAGTATAQGVGGSVAPSTGSASGSSTASAVGALSATLSGTGTAAGTSTAVAVGDAAIPAVKRQHTAVIRELPRRHTIAEAGRSHTVSDQSRKTTIREGIA